MPAEETKEMRKFKLSIPKLFISDYDKFAQGLREVFSVGTDHEPRWVFREYENEVIVVAEARGPDDLLKELQELGYLEKQEMEQKAPGSMGPYYMMS